ncbi:MAG: threonine/homoserine/homoserine lactone efflux protein [Cocleimonas sp.]|jgi:threonine/homoserine/homoserine lactone efflux protein
MTEFQTFLPSILLTYFTYLIIIASPGPATLATMTISMNRGRKAGVIFGLGIVTGSFIWASLAFSGVAQVLHTHSSALIILKIIGGSYLLWMAYKAFKSATTVTPTESKINLPELSPLKIYLQALALHLTNPKPIFAWLAIVSIGIQKDTPIWVVFSIFLGCAILVLSVFMLYAFIFSSETIIIKYRKARRPIEAFMTVVFGYAGMKLIMDEI